MQARMMLNTEGMRNRPQQQDLTLAGGAGALDDCEMCRRTPSLRVVFEGITEPRDEQAVRMKGTRIKRGRAYLA